MAAVGVAEFDVLLPLNMVLDGAKRVAEIREFIPCYYRPVLI